MKPNKGADIIEFVSETVGDDLIEVCNAKVSTIFNVFSISLAVIWGHFIFIFSCI